MTTCTQQGRDHALQPHERQAVNTDENRPLQGAPKGGAHVYTGVHTPPNDMHPAHEGIQWPHGRTKAAARKKTTHAETVTAVKWPKPRRSAKGSPSRSRRTCTARRPYSRNELTARTAR